MKKQLFGLLFAMVAVNAVGNNDSGELAVVLAQNAAQIYVAHENHKNSQPSQSNFLKRIYWMYKNNPHFYKLHAFKEDLDYYLAVLPDHIKKLEDKILAGKSGLTSNSMLKGFITTAISAGCGYGASWLYRQTSNPEYAHMTLDFTYGYVGTGLVSALFAAVAAHNFYKVVRYAERLVERLDRDKKLLELLEEQKALNGEVTIDGMAIKVMNVIVEALKGAVDQAVIAAADKAKEAVVPAIAQEVVATEPVIADYVVEMEPVILEPATNLELVREAIFSAAAQEVVVSEPVIIEPVIADYVVEMEPIILIEPATTAEVVSFELEIAEDAMIEVVEEESAALEIAELMAEAV